jgi:hypothetical protein
MENTVQTPEIERGVKQARTKGRNPRVCRVPGAFAVWFMALWCAASATEEARGCVECPGYDSTLLTPTTSWQHDSRSIGAYSCWVYRISLQEGETYTAKTGCGDGATANFDTVIGVVVECGEEGGWWCYPVGYDECEQFRSKVTWTAPYSGNCLLLIMAEDYAPGSFTLAYRREPHCELEVTQPSGGGEFCPDDSIAILWEPSGDCTAVKIELMDGGSVARVIASSTSNNGTYDWVVPADLTGIANARVRVSCLTPAACSDLSGIFSVWTDPQITQQPYDRFALVGGALAFWVRFTGGDTTLHCEWRHNGQNLDPNDPRFRGVNDWLLVINPVAVADAGQYDVVLAGECGDAISEPAVLIVPPLGDMNCDGATDVGDINPFVMAISDPNTYMYSFPYCDIMLGDVNQDGVLDFADIVPFTNCLSTGHCP